MRSAIWAIAEVCFMLCALCLATGNTAWAQELPWPVVINPDLPLVKQMGLTPQLLQVLRGVDQRRVLYLERLKQYDRAPELFTFLQAMSFDELLGLVVATPRILWADQELSHILVKTLVEQHHVPDQHMDRLPDPAILALADYLSQEKDSRCLSLYEGLLAKKGKGPDGALTEIYGIGRYWSRTGNYAKAAETFLRAPNYSTVKPLLANCTLEAARQYLRLGDEKKAFVLYESVSSYGYAWATGMSYADRASQLIRQGKHAEARKLLTTPVEGQYADQMKIILFERLGESYYQTKEFEQAARYFQQSVKQYESIPNLLQEHGLESVVDSAKRRLSEIAANKH